MFQKHMLAGFALFVATVTVASTSAVAWAQQQYGNGGLFGRCGGAIRNGYRGPYAAGSGNRPWSGPPNRYYDSTGRWTGDGVDTMSTAKPTWQRSANVQPNSPH